MFVNRQSVEELTSNTRTRHESSGLGPVSRNESGSPPPNTVKHFPDKKSQFRKVAKRRKPSELASDKPEGLRPTARMLTDSPPRFPARCTRACPAGETESSGCVDCDVGRDGIVNGCTTSDRLIRRQPNLVALDRSCLAKHDRPALRRACFHMPALSPGGR